jgi:hypothetical protein
MHESLHADYTVKVRMPVKVLFFKTKGWEAEAKEVNA